jgi:hypothetical protein
MSEQYYTPEEILRMTINCEECGLPYQRKDLIAIGATLCCGKCLERIASQYNTKENNNENSRRMARLGI